MARSLLRSIDARTIKFSGLYAFVSLRSVLPNYCSNPWETIWIDPDRIEWSHKSRPVHGTAESEIGFDPYLDVGRIAGGAWDRSVTTKFERMPKYRAVSEHFNEGVPWEETELFDQLIDLIDERGSFDGCRTPDDLRHRYQRIDQLYERLRSGYRSREELCGRFDFHCLIDTPKVHIGRDGRLIHAGGSGYHRIAIASVLEKNIEVHVVVRHEEWVKKRAQIQTSLTPSGVPEGLRPYVDHPDVDTRW